MRVRMRVFLIKEAGRERERVCEEGKPSASWATPRINYEVLLQSMNVVY